MQRHYNLYAQMEKQQDQSHAEELEHYHMQLPERSHPLDSVAMVSSETCAA